MARKKVSIIGAGIGGLATAARLASKGYAVEVFERLPHCGGRNNIRRQQGFLFDTGPSFVLMPDFFEECFRSCGEDLKQYLRLHPLEVSYQIFYPDGKQLTVYKDTEKTKESLSRFQENAGESFEGFMRETGELYKSVRSLLYRCFKPSDLVSPVLWPLVTRLRPFQTYWQLARKYFSSEHLCYAFTFEAMFIGVSPFQTPAFYSIISYTDHRQKIFHPMGGMYQIPLALERIARKHGAVFHYDCTMDDFIHPRTFVSDDGRVSTSGERVVVNADLPFFKKHVLKQSIPAYDYSCSVYLLYLGLKKKVRGLAHHNLFFSSDLRRNLQQIFGNGMVPDDPSFYVHVPTVTDASLAPEGKDLVYILIPVANLHKGNSLTPQDEERLKRYVYEKISRVIGERLSDCVHVEESFYPDDFVSEYQIMHGATFGLAHTLRQSAFFRPRNFLPRSDISFVGASTQPGGGLPVVLASSRIVADHILSQDS